MPIELLPLCEFKAVLGQPLVVGPTPMGTRIVLEVASGEVKGERFSGTVKGAANADWALIGADGTGTIDVRVLVETHDGALVFVQYLGRIDMSLPLDATTAYSAPRFETGDARYAWLNKVQAIAKGKLDGEAISYEVYEVR
jgi:hypothetical protein